MTFLPLLDFDEARLRAVLREQGSRLCDYSYISIFMWSGHYGTAIAEEDGFLFVRATDPVSGRSFYAIPHRGEALIAAVSRLLQHTGAPLFLYGIPEGEVEGLRAAFGERLSAETHESDSDYLYELADLASYAGRKYNQKRNHVNAFLREHPMAVYEPITEDNIGAVRAFFADYRVSEEKDTGSAHREGAGAAAVLDRFFALGAEGGLLREGERILGFFVGERMGDVLYLHIEKATRTVRGAYPYLVQSAARAYLGRVRYENREEDDGDEGLRQSKRSYQPVALLSKYRVKIRPIG